MSGQSQTGVQTGRSSAEKDLGILVVEKSDMSCKFTLAALKVNCIQGCINRGVNKMSREVIVALCSALMRPHLESCTQVWGPQHKKDVERKG